MLAMCCCAAIATPSVAQVAPSAAASTADAATRPLTLDAALAAADSANIDVITARLAVRTAQAGLRSADTAPNPIVSVNTVQIRPGSIGRLPFGQLVDTVARADLPLERGGKRAARVGAARASIDAAEGDLDDARRQMRLAVENAYLALKAAEARSAVLRAIATNYADVVRIAGTQRSAGALSESDQIRQRVEGLRAQSDAQQALADLRDARLALALLIGRETDADTLATTGDWPTPVTAIGVATPPEMIAQRRADVRAATARVEAARRNLDGAHALRHPDVTVGAQYERADGDLGVGNSVGFGVSIPLPVRNRYNGEVDAASTAVVQAEATARRTLAVAVADIDMARRALRDATQRRQLIEETQLPAARRASSIAEFAFSHGAMTLLDVLDARRSLEAVELGAIDARALEARAAAQLRAAETTGTN